VVIIFDLADISPEQLAALSALIDSGIVAYFYFRD
jgi:hypothetical protein